MTEDFPETILRLLLDEKLIPHEGEFQTVTGFYFKEYRELRDDLRAAAAGSSLNDHQFNMLYSAITTISGYPHGKEDILEQEFSIKLQTQNDYIRLGQLLQERLDTRRSG